jgi:hypothetical protein
MRTDEPDVPLTPEPAPLALIMTLRGAAVAGTGSREVKPDHPLVIHLRVAIEEGRPPGSWSWAAFAEEESGRLRVIGTFVHSPPPGDRILFFPGGTMHISTAPFDELTTDEPMSSFDDKRLDHLTLDPPDSRGRHQSHVAVFGLPMKGSRGLGYRTTPPPGLLIPWFTLLTPSLEEFEFLPEKLIVTFPPLRPDLSEFAKEFMRGPKLAHAPAPTASTTRTVFQFDVWAGRGLGWKQLGSRSLAGAYKPEVVKGAPTGNQVIRQFDVDLSSDVGVRIVASRPPGQLDSARLLRPRLSS